MTSPGKISPQDLESVITRGVSEIISRDEFIRMLQSGKKLRLKMGFDPSRPDIHLGHVVGLRKLRQLQDLGHHVVLIVGDWTAQIGDPSGQSATRTMLTHEQVLENAESYLRQFFKVVDKNRAEVIYQSEWFGKFGLANVLELTACSLWLSSCSGPTLPPGSPTRNPSPSRNCSTRCCRPTTPLPSRPM